LRRLLIVTLLIVFTLPLFAEKVLYMRPVTKNIDRADAKRITGDLEVVLKSKFNYVSYKNLSKSSYRSFKKCGSNATCWYDNSDGDFQYSILTLISRNDYDEVIVRTVLIGIDMEEVIEDVSKTYDDVDSADKKSIYRQLRQLTKTVYRDIKSGSRSSKSDRSRVKKGRSDNNGDEVEKRMAKEREKKVREEEERKEREDSRRRKLEEERRKREIELEKRKEAEAKRRKQIERKRRIDAERKRREEERERESLEKERARREQEKKRERMNKRRSLEENSEKLTRARELVLEMCAQGKYNVAIKAIVKVSKLKCECEEDAKVLALKTQLLNFNKVRGKILKGVKLLDHNLILDNLEAAKALDEYIVPGGTDFSKKIDKIEAIGYMAKGRAMEKQDNYTLANEAFDKCVYLDSNKTECKEWLDSKGTLVKRIYDKASVMKNFNPTKAKELLRSIVKLVTAENEYYKKAEADLKTMSY